MSVVSFLDYDDGDWLMLGENDEDGANDIVGLMLGAGTNGIEKVVLSSSSNSPPSAINAPFEVTL